MKERSAKPNSLHFDDARTSRAQQKANTASTQFMLMEQAAFAVTAVESGYPSIAEADSTLYSEKSSLTLFLS